MRRLLFHRYARNYVRIIIFTTIGYAMAVISDSLSVAYEPEDRLNEVIFQDDPLSVLVPARPLGEGSMQVTVNGRSFERIARAFPLL